MMLQKGLVAFGDKLPKVISPKTHAIMDYATIGIWALVAARAWGKNRTAALGAVACAGAQLATVLMTDFPGGVFDVMDFPTHGKVDLGLAAAATSLPNMLGIDETSEAKWFRILGMNITAETAMTDFGYRRPVKEFKAA